MEISNAEFMYRQQREMEREQQKYLALSAMQNAYPGGLLSSALLGANQQQNTEAKRQVSQPEPNPVLLLLE